MNKNQPNLLAAPRVSAATVLLRWLILLLVVFDLASSPLHMHSHDLGGSGSIAGQSIGSDVHAQEDHPHDAHHDALGTHVHSSDGPSFAHSVLALVPSQLPVLAPVLFAITVLSPALLVQAVDDPGRSAWRASDSLAPPGHDRHWRPITRAPPPFLHA